MNKTRLTVVTAMVAAFAMVLSGLALADNLQDDVVAAGNGTFTAGGSTTVNYHVHPNGNDGCNVDSANTATMLVNAPAGLHANPTSLTFDACGVSKAVVYSTNTAGTYHLQPTISGGKPNNDGWNANPAKATLTVNPPSGTANTAPTVAFTDGPTSVDESSTAEHEYSFSITDPDDNTWTFVSGYPSCGTGGTPVAGSASIDGSAKTGTFKCKFDDGPTSPIVTAKVSDGTAPSNEATRAVTVSNVAPTASLSLVGVPNVFTGTTVTYNASATDPSLTDTNSGYTWSFNGGAYGSAASLTETYTTCGEKSVSVKAKDKDGGESSAASASVNVYDGGWHGAIKPAMRNLVQSSRVVPVQIQVGCAGTPLADLTPGIALLGGDVDPSTPDSGADAVLTPTSASTADTGGIMRATEDGYIYNLQIPKGSVGQKYTIRVRPWGTEGATLQAVLEIRK